MKKILHLCLANFYADNYTYQENMLPKYHKKLGYDVSVVASMQTYDESGKKSFLSNTERYYCSDGYPVSRLKYRKYWNSVNRFLRRYDGTYEAIERENPSIIFIHGCQFWDIKYVIQFVKKYPEVQVIVDNHADHVNSAKNRLSRIIKHGIIWKYCAKRVEPFVKIFFGVTPVRCDFLMNTYGISPDNIQLLVMGADSEMIDFEQRDKIRNSIREEFGIQKGDFVIIAGGKIRKKTRIDLLMRAVKELNPPGVKLIVFGSVDELMMPVVNELSDSEGIINIGWIDSNKVYNYYLASDLAFFPGTHSVLWEQAVGTGIPCVFRHWKRMDHVDLGGNCMFLHEDSVEAITDLLKTILGNRSVYLEMKKVALEKGIDEFSYERIARDSLLLEYNQ